VCGLLPNKNGVKNNKLYDVCHGIDLTFSSQNCYVLINLFVESDLGDPVDAYFNILAKISCVINFLNKI